VACVLVWVLGSLPILPIPRWLLRWRQRAARVWALGLAAICGMRRSVRGTPPRPPFLLVANHLSYLDVILLLTWLDGIFVAKREMRSWPLLGPLAHLAGTIWVRREVRRDAVRVLDEMDEALARGDGVMLFPEGTTSDGSGILPLRPALLDWAAREQFPVHFAALSYRTPAGQPPASRVLSWWGTMPFGAHLVNLLRLSRFDALVEFGATPVRAPTRAELAARLREALLERFTPSGGAAPAGTGQV
jgi:1-acyl-sn-glycerol-3-phosphate acyltransferase